MLSSEAIAILRESNSKLLQCINQLQGFPLETMDKKMREKYNYTLKKALREMEAVEMAIAALGDAKKEKTISILAVFPESERKLELITFRADHDLDLTTILKEFKSLNHNSADWATAKDHAVENAEERFQCHVTRTEIYTIEVW